METGTDNYRKRTSEHETGLNWNCMNVRDDGIGEEPAYNKHCSQKDCCEFHAAFTGPPCL